ncbi:MULTISPECIES: hypothetical protein [unclassified Nostoc]|uniref:hypothetical protein n=1 Tax=unclassified Nostoc TaxID=2593658 RepID=UPI00262CE19B|nr:hypothetical protein [Nostoc sp. S13]MDF5737193.1 hypothetical protein [Nostoc sp. S13]
MLQTTNSQVEIRNNFKVIKELKPAVTKAGLQQNSQNTEYFPRAISKQQLVTGIDSILKTCVYQKKGMNPRIFCRRWFGLEDMDNDGRVRYTENLILAMESEHGYREKCINLIARLLKIKPNTIHRWGKGVEFDKIPPDKREQYETYLGYVDTIRVMTLSIAGINEDLLPKILHHL